MEHYPSIAASLSTSHEALYKHTLVKYRFCRRTKLIFLRNSLLRYAVTLGRCALPSCKSYLFLASTCLQMPMQMPYLAYAVVMRRLQVCHSHIYRKYRLSVQAQTSDYIKISARFGKNISHKRPSPNKRPVRISAYIFIFSYFISLYTE